MDPSIYNKSRGDLQPHLGLLIQKKPSMASARDSDSSSLIIDIHPKVLGDLCRCLDCLSDWEWLQFASLVISDQTTVQMFWMKRKVGDSATRELLWSWSQKLATLQDLEVILQDLELYRALDILRQCSQDPAKTSPSEERKAVQSSGAEQNNRNCSSVAGKVPEFAAKSLPSPPPPPVGLLESLKIDSDADLVSSTDEALSIPQQEISLTLDTSCHHWTAQQLDEATDRFSADRKIHSGQFADVFLGRRADKIYAIKRLKEEECEQTDKMHFFFQTEAQISFRCNHPNLLRILGFCVDGGHCCLVNQYMKNGSLDVALHEAGSNILSWERRLGIATGLLLAVHHLHEAGIFHGNIKSSNVFLDEDFSPKLGHSGARFCPDRSANYTQVKTYEFQRYQPYLPDSYLRRGQLTAQTDIFSSGVVLAEIMTGQKPCDKSRDPAYLKDLILTEMEQAKMCVESSCKKMESAEPLCAKQMNLKYLDAKPGRLAGNAALHLVCAVCLCITKKKVLLPEVIATMEKAEMECRISIKESQKEVTSMNIPEESDESLSLGLAVGGEKDLLGSSSKTHGSLDCTSIPGALYCPAVNEVSKRSPCELDESGNYLLSPGGSWYDEGINSTSSQPVASTAGHQAHPRFTRPLFPVQNLPRGSPKTSLSPTESNDPSWGIEVNKPKMKLMEDIELYQDEKVDSSVLFDSA